jgi:hypothetical protein
MPSAPDPARTVAEGILQNLKKPWRTQAIAPSVTGGVAFMPRGVAVQDLERGRDDD